MTLSIWMLSLLASLSGGPSMSDPANALPEFDKLWNFSKPEETEQQFRDLVPAARASGDVDYLAQLLTQLARTLGLQRKFDDAHRVLDEVEPMLRADLTKARVRYLLERGRTFRSSGKPEESKPLFIAAWELGQASRHDNLAVDAAHMVAIIETADQAEIWTDRAMKFAEASPDTSAKKWLGALYNNLGWTYHESGRYPDALELFQKGESWRREQQQEPETRIAVWSVARCLRSLGRVEEALQKQEALEAEWRAAGESDGYVFEELGECLLALGRGDEAKPWFASAHEELSKDEWLKANEAARLTRLADLGGVQAK